MKITEFKKLEVRKTLVSFVSGDKQYSSLLNEGVMHLVLDVSDQRTVLIKDRNAEGIWVGIAHLEVVPEFTRVTVADTAPSGLAQFFRKKKFYPVSSPSQNAYGQFYKIIGDDQGLFNVRSDNLKPVLKNREGTYDWFQDQYGKAKSRLAAMDKLLLEDERMVEIEKEMDDLVVEADEVLASRRRLLKIINGED